MQFFRSLRRARMRELYLLRKITGDARRGESNFRGFRLAGFARSEALIIYIVYTALLLDVLFLDA